jgi:hypothetical protein
MSRLRFVCAALALGALTSAFAAPALRWVASQSQTNHFVVEVTGLPKNALPASDGWKHEQWQRLLAVYAEQGDLNTDLNLPPMLGAYRVADGVIRFEPEFPLQAGVRYRAVFFAGELPAGAGGIQPFLSATHRVPAPTTQPTTVVSAIYPSADVLPENLLKFYLHFSAPMSRGHIYDHIALRDSSGKPVELPFLEIDEELWDASMTRLTLFIDPGRIKREVKPLEDIGPALEAGKTYTIEISRAWHDATGSPLREAFQKRFKVSAPDREPPDPATWKLTPPAAGAKKPLTVTFPEPLDHALALRLIRVLAPAGTSVDGTAALSDNERRWTFTPREPWRRGQHQLVVQTTIEDLAGNNIGKPFEVDLFEGVQRRLTNSAVKLPFVVK